jgi:hypothetical protein
VGLRRREVRLARRSIHGRVNVIWRDRMMRGSSISAVRIERTAHPVPRGDVSADLRDCCPATRGAGEHVRPPSRPRLGITHSDEQNVRGPIKTVHILPAEYGRPGGMRADGRCADRPVLLHAAGDWMALAVARADNRPGPRAGCLAYVWWPSGGPDGLRKFVLPVGGCLGDRSGGAAPRLPRLMQEAGACPGTRLWRRRPL